MFGSLYMDERAKIARVTEKSKYDDALVRAAGDQLVCYAPTADPPPIVCLTPTISKDQLHLLRYHLWTHPHCNDGAKWRAIADALIDREQEHICLPREQFHALLEFFVLMSPESGVYLLAAMQALFEFARKATPELVEEVRRAKKAQEAVPPKQETPLPPPSQFHRNSQIKFEFILAVGVGMFPILGIVVAMFYCCAQTFGELGAPAGAAAGAAGAAWLFAPHWRDRLHLAPDDDLEADVATDECILCRTYSARIIIVPCGHIMYCHGCVAEMERQPERCPMCNAAAASLLRPYER